MARFGLKTTTFLQQQKKSKIKVIEWEIKKTTRGIKNVPVDVTATASRHKSRQTRRQDTQKTNNDKAALHDASPISMDVDEDIWMEEPVASKKKRVGLPPCSSSAVFDTSNSPKASTPTWNSLFPGLAPTCAAFLILRVRRQRQCARAAGLLHFSGSAPTVSPLLHFARSAAESPTRGFLFTGFRSGREIIFFHRGCGRLE
jgi:hypothetical protein